MRSFPRFCNIFFWEFHSWYAASLLLRQAGVLSENCLQNLRKDLVADSILNHDLYFDVNKI